MVEREHAQVEQDAHHPGAPAQRQAQGRGGGRGENGIGDRRIIVYWSGENRSGPAASRASVPWSRPAPVYQRSNSTVIRAR